MIAIVYAGDPSRRAREIGEVDSAIDFWTADRAVRVRRMITVMILSYIEEARYIADTRGPFITRCSLTYQSMNSISC